VNRVTPSHFEQSLQRDVEVIRGKVTEMSALAEQALKACLKALHERNRQLAYAVILRDQRIDELEKQIDRLCLEFLVRQQPVAGLLRFAYATIRINLELERVGDYAESIARQTLKLLDLDVQIPIERFLEMANLSIPMLREATRAFVEQNADLARKTIETEEVVDVLKSQLNKDLISLFRENKLSFDALNPLIAIARRLERVSDQARNISMETLYMCTGEYAKHPGTDAVRVLFVDEYNSCRSQMAEAIGRTLHQPSFIFASAGLEPKPIEPSTIDFLREKGLDLSRMEPKAIHQLPNLDHYQVIVLLASEAKRAFPQHPRKVVLLDWSLKDPSTVHGTPAEVRAAYEAACQFLEVHIKELVQAILGETHQP
jgi:phosphate transport system protein